MLLQTHCLVLLVQHMTHINKVVTLGIFIRTSKVNLIFPKNWSLKDWAPEKWSNVFTEDTQTHIPAL